jgi:hypothetical protein
MYRTHPSAGGVVKIRTAISLCQTVQMTPYVYVPLGYARHARRKIDDLLSNLEFELKLGLLKSGRSKDTRLAQQKKPVSINK